MPLPIELPVRGRAQPSSSIFRSHDQDQRWRSSFQSGKPSWSRPQSRRFRPMLRLFEHFALTWAFVETAEAQIANGSSSWPLRSRSAMTRLLGRVGGHSATKTTPVCCRAASRAGWQLMILISYLWVQKEIMSDFCGNARGLTVPGQLIARAPSCLF